jgi:hypothetical protein
LLEGKVGQPYSEEELENIYQKAEKRFSYKKPPGYKVRIAIALCVLPLCDRVPLGDRVLRSFLLPEIP